MNENLNENVVEQENTVNVDNDENGFSKALFEDITNGLHSVLFKRINNVTINDIRIQTAFRDFTKLVECGESFSIADMISAAEHYVSGKQPDTNAGNGIYIIDNFKTLKKRIWKKVVSYSVEGIYMLIALNNGVSVDIDLIGGSLVSGEAKRFLIVSQNNYKKLKKVFDKNNVTCTKVGEMISAEEIVLSKGDEIVARVSKKPINDQNESVSISLGINEFNAFVSGYNSVLSVSLCDTVSKNNVIRFGLGDGIESVFARALGYFSAVTYLRNVPVRHLFTADKTATVTVARPKVSDGDYVYLLRVRNDQFGLPEKPHFAQLCFYLSEKKRMGIIKDILPSRDNMERVLYRLCGENLEFERIAEDVEYRFGVIVTVGRGESVNGIKIGYFKERTSIEPKDEGEIK